MVYFWLAFLAVTLFVSVRRTSYGCCCLLVSRILIPECVRLTPLLDLSLNTCVIGIVAMAALRDVVLGKTHLLKDGFVKALAVFMGLFLMALPFADTLDFAAQRANWLQFLATDISPAILFIIALRKKSDLTLVLKVLFITCLVNCVYGCVTIAIGGNPYAFMLNSLYSKREQQMNAFNDALNIRGGILTTSSTFEHSNGWGYFLPITFVLFFFVYTRYKYLFKEKTLLLLLVLLAVSVVICGKRSAYVSFTFFWLAYFVLNKGVVKIKFVAYGLIALAFLLVTASLFPELEKVRNILESSLMFWDDNLMVRNDVGGSSMQLRIAQTIYPWVEIKNNIFLGHGFGWCNVYLNKYELHPILFGFETIFSSAVCQGGVLGVFLWCFIFFKAYRYSINDKESAMWPRLFTLVQLAIAVATGLSYFVFYGIYIVIINKLYLLDENISRNGHVQLCEHLSRNA